MPQGPHRRDPGLGSAMKGPAVAVEHPSCQPGPTAEAHVLITPAPATAWAPSLHPALAGHPTAPAWPLAPEPPGWSPAMGLSLWPPRG